MWLLYSFASHISFVKCISTKIPTIIKSAKRANQQHFTFAPKYVIVSIIHFRKETKKDLIRRNFIYYLYMYTTKYIHKVQHVSKYQRLNGLGFDITLLNVFISYDFGPVSFLCSMSYCVQHHHQHHAHNIGFSFIDPSCLEIWWYWCWSTQFLEENNGLIHASPVSLPDACLCVGGI